VDLARATSSAPVAATWRRNALPSKARSSSTSMPGPSRDSSRRATAGSSRSAADPSAAPGRPRVPVSASVISRSVGYPAKPIRYRIRPSHPRLRLVSGALSELQPSKATVRSPPNRAPGVPGWASGPATNSNSAFSGAGPSRRRRSRSAFSDGRGTSSPASPAVSLAQTRA
jgi:hypothetical protein